MKNVVRILIWTCFLSAVSALAQPPVAVRVTGEHRVARYDTAETAKQAALIDATQKAVQEAATHLRDLPEVKALLLKPTQLDAFLAAILSTQEQASRTAANGTVHQVDVVVQLDTPDVVRRLSALRKDQDVANQLVELWQQTQELHRQILETPSTDTGRSQQDQQLALTRLEAKHLFGQVSVALARTQEGSTSARVSTAEGRSRARQLAETALAKAPDIPDAHYAMGDVLAITDEWEAAEAEYRKALQESSDSSSGHIRLAGALRQKGKNPEAIAELREAIRLQPNSALAHTDLGVLLAAERNNADAMAEFQEALRLDRDFIDAHNNLAINLARQRRIPEAVVEFREIVRIDPDSAIGYFNLASALADMDKDQESAAALREVIRINPNHYNAHFNLGDLFRLEEKFDDAVTQFGEYVRLAPDTPQNQRNIQRAKDFIQTHQNQ